MADLGEGNTEDVAPEEFQEPLEPIPDALDDTTADENEMDAEHSQDGDNDELFCKICRLGSEEGNALYHPCKCSGSIRYVHEPCLLEWIKHSKATKCELCKHVYKFTDVYGPPREPMLTSMLGQVKTTLQNLPSNILFLLRSVLVGLVWGVTVPILLAEIWHYIMGTVTYPWFVDESDQNLLPHQINPVRLLVSAFKGVFILAGLLIGSGTMFLIMEQTEAYLEHVTFMRNHRRNRRANAAPNAAPPVDNPAQDHPQAAINEPEPLIDENVDAEDDNNENNDNVDILRQDDVDTLGNDDDPMEEVPDQINEDDPMLNADNEGNNHEEAPNIGEDAVPEVEANDLEEEAYLAEFDDEDDEDSEALQQHWLIAIFGRRDRDQERNAQENNEEQQEEVSFTDLLGLTGNMAWIIVVVIFVLVFGTLALTFAILVPQLVGKLYTASFDVVSHTLLPYIQSLIYTIPILQETAFSFFSRLQHFSILFPTSTNAMAIVFNAIVTHPITNILIQPTSIGYLICAVAILSFSAKRSPLAILIRNLITYAIDFIVMPAILGGMMVYFVSSIVHFDEPVQRAPFYSRIRMSSLESKIYDRSYTIADFLWSKNSTLGAAVGFVARQAISNLSNANISMNSTLSSSVDPVLASIRSENITNIISVANATVSSIAASTIGRSATKSATNDMIEKVVSQTILQINDYVISFYTHYLELTVHIFVGYLVLIAWVSILKTVRDSLKPGLIWFLKFPGDNDFSFFLFLANNRMTHILRHIGTTLLFHMTSLLVVVGIPIAIISWLISTSCPSLFQIAGPTSSFQIRTDANIGITFIPLSLLLIKPIKTTGAFIRSLSRFVAKVFDVEAEILPVRPAPAPPAAPEAAQAPRNANEGELPVPVAAAAPNPPEAVQPANGENNHGDQPVKRWLKLRIGGATALGIAIFTMTVFGCLTVPWTVGTFVYHIWMPEAEGYPMYSMALGAYFVALAVRTMMVYVNIYRAHRGVAATILPDDEEARGVLARTTFDNAFRATVILLALLLVIPVILGYLVRIVLINSLLPGNVMVTIHSPLNEYAYGLILMRSLDALTKFPIPLLAPARQVLDTLGFDTIVQVDYTAFLVQIVYPIASFTFLLLGIPTIANVAAYFYLSDLPDDVFVNLNRKAFIILPIAFIVNFILYQLLVSFLASIDQFFNGKIVVGRQIHNFDPDNAALEQNAQPQDQHPPPPPPPPPQDPLLEHFFFQDGHGDVEPEQEAPVVREGEQHDDPLPAH